MRLAVERFDLLLDGILPCDSIMAEKYRQVFCSAKPLIDYAFKVDRAAFVRVWWFDRYLPRVVNLDEMPRRPEQGKFYPLQYLRSESDLNVAYYLQELGYQVRFSVRSIDRLEFAVLVVFDAQGAILEDSEAYRLKILEAMEIPPTPLDDRLPVWMPDRDGGRERVGV